MLTEIYLCHARSCHEIEDGDGAPGLGAHEVAALVFYAGHGCQMDATNYLVPTDCTLNATLPALVPVADIFDAASATTGPKVVIIDASHRVSRCVL